MGSGLITPPDPATTSKCLHVGAKVGVDTGGSHAGSLGDTALPRATPWTSIVAVTSDRCRPGPSTGTVPFIRRASLGVDTGGGPPAGARDMGVALVSAPHLFDDASFGMVPRPFGPVPADGVGVVGVAIVMFSNNVWFSNEGCPVAVPVAARVAYTGLPQVLAQYSLSFALNFLTYRKHG